MSKKMILAGCFVVLTFVSQAQVTDEPMDSLELAEVVITGLKFPASLKESAKPIQVISREEIDLSGAKDLSQLLQDQSGMIINGAYSNPGAIKGVFTRGAGSDFTLILLDGVPVFDPSGSGGAYDLRLLPLGQIERIEILKGSQSTLYGSGAVAGVINIITQKKGKDAFSLNGTASVGSLNTSNVSGEASGKAGWFDYQIGGQRYFTKGISEAESPSDTLVFDEDGFEQYGFHTRLGFRPSEKIAIRPFVRYSKSFNDFDDGSFADAANRFDSEFTNAGLRADYRGGRFQARLDYAYGATNRTFISAFGESLFRGRLHNLEGSASFEVSGWLQLLGGIAYQDQQLLDSTTVVTDPSINILSPYLTALLNPIEDLSLELGYRYNNHSLFGSNSNYNVAASYQLNSYLKLFGSYTTGFLAPSLSQLYGAFGANENLDPQKSQSWEVGTRFDVFGKGLQIQLTYYQREIEDLIVFDFVNGFQNRDLQDDQGLEFNLDWRLNERLSLGFSYDFVTGEITQNLDGQSDTTFNNLIRRPKNALRLRAFYRPIDPLRIRLSAQWMDDRDDLFFNPANFFIAEGVTLDSYFLLNAYIEYALLDGQLNLFADLKNITDSDFNEVYGFSGLNFNAQFGLRLNID